MKDFRDPLDILRLNLVGLIGRPAFHIAKHLGGLRGFFESAEGVGIFGISLHVPFPGSLLLLMGVGSDLSLAFLEGLLSIAVFSLGLAVFSLLSGLLALPLVPDRTVVEKLFEGWPFLALAVDDAQGPCLQCFRARRVVEADLDFFIAKYHCRLIVYFNEDHWLIVVVECTDATVSEFFYCHKDFGVPLQLIPLRLLVIKCNPGFGIVECLRLLEVTKDLALVNEIGVSLLLL